VSRRSATAPSASGCRHPLRAPCPDPPVLGGCPAAARPNRMCIVGGLSNSTIGVVMTRIRLGGATLLVGCVALIFVMLVALVVSDPLHGGVVALTALTIEAVASVLVLLGMPAILASQGNRATRLGLAGYVGVFTNVAFGNLFLSLTFAIVLPWAADQGSTSTAATPSSSCRASRQRPGANRVHWPARSMGAAFCGSIRGGVVGCWLQSTALTILSAVPLAGSRRYRRGHRPLCRARAHRAPARRRRRTSDRYGRRPAH
jgi:hypothetical protein